MFRMILAALLAATVGLVGCAGRSNENADDAPSDDSSGNYYPLPGARPKGWIRGTRVTAPIVALTPGPGEPAWFETQEFHVSSSTEAIPSWNVTATPGVGVWFEIRVFDETSKTWSPWLFISEWGERLAPEPIATEYRGGKVEVDILKTAKPFGRVQMRVHAACGPGVTRESWCFLEHLWIEVSDSEPEELHAPLPGAAIGTPIDLPVPFLTQKTDREELSGRLCSPTSVAMVLKYWGKDVNVQQVAELAHDSRHDIYGNWARNTQAASTFGLRASVIRMQSWGQVEYLLQRGVPLVISFWAGEGELRNAPYAKTSGHLIVVRGMDANGDLLVNDPAAGTAESGQRTYLRADLDRVWLKRNLGTAYAIAPADKWNEVVWPLKMHGVRTR